MTAVTLRSNRISVQSERNSGPKLISELNILTQRHILKCPVLEVVYGSSLAH